MVRVAVAGALVWLAAACVCVSASGSSEAGAGAARRLGGDSDGAFFQITDFHYEPLYCAGCYVKDFCRKADVEAGAAERSDDTGTLWGSYDCDIPLVMAESAAAFLGAEAAAVARELGVPAGAVPVLWTGDSGPHKLTEADEDSSLNAILESTRLLLAALPAGTPVFPTIGNLDVFPNGQLELKASQKLFEHLADAWEPWLTVGAQAQFRQTGYFIQPLPGTDLSVISLNTVLWYESNDLSRPHLSADPLGQFAWLEGLLAAASAAKSRVIIMGHVPPQNYHSDYNAAYVKIVRKYASSIDALIFAHWHQNMVSFLWSDDSAVRTDGHGPITDVPIMMQYSASSVTSRKGRNPSVRLYSTNATSGITDFTVYSNSLADTIARNATSWAPLYSARAAYDMPDLSIASWYQLYTKLYDEAPTSDRAAASSGTALWDLFVGEHLVSNAYECDKSCAKVIVAKFECIDLNETKDCDDIPSSG